MLEKSVSFYEKVADLIQSEIINIEHMVQLLLNISGVVNKAADEILPLFTDLNSYFLAKTVKSYILSTDLINLKNPNDLIVSKQERIKKVLQILNEDIKISEEDISELTLNTLNDKVKMPTGKQVLYSKITHVPTISEILNSSDRELIHPQNAMRLPNEIVERHPLEVLLYNYTKFVEEMSGIKRKNQVKELEDYCYLFLNDMIRNIISVFQILFRLITEYYASIDIIYYRELHCTIILQALSSDLNLNEKEKLLEAKESILDSYTKISQFIFQFRERFPLFESTFKFMDFEGKVSSSNKYHHFFEKDLYERHTFSVDLAIKHLEEINDLIKSTLSKGDWLNLSDKRKLTMIQIYGGTTNFIFDSQSLLSDVKKINEHFLNSCWNIYQFSKIELLNKDVFVETLNNSVTQYEKKIVADIEEELLDEIENTLYTFNYTPSKLEKIDSYKKHNYLFSSLHQMIQLTLDNKIIAAKKLRLSMILYVCEARLPAIVFSRIKEAFCSEENELSLKGIYLKGFGGKSLEAISAYIISADIQLLNLSTCALSSCEYETLEKVFETIINSNIHTLIIRNNQLNKLTSDKWDVFCETLKYSKIRTLDVENNHLDECKLKELDVIIENNIRRYTLKNDVPGLLYTVSRFIWSKNAFNKTSLNNLTKSISMNLVQKINEQERYGLKN